jgi:hypothetical protein
MAGKLQAGRIRAAIWLGHRTVDAVADSHDAATRLIRRLADDQGLMAGVLALCDTAHDHFERHGDPADRAFVDAFSIELLDLIGDYLARRPAR